MLIRFWGTRGSLPTPGPGTIRYGGNTSCVEVRTDGGTLLVLDCGTGARALGLQLLQEAAGGPPPAGSILIGHTHWDHIHGIPFFAPLFVPGSQWDVYGPRGLVRTIDKVLAGQMEYQYFPVGLDEVGADVRYHDLVEGVFEIGDATIRTQYLNHPALTLGFRIEADGATVVYSSDHEPHDATLAAGGRPAAGSLDARHADFLAGADLVVHDAQYDAAGYGSKVGWGHSTMEYVVSMASAAGAARLALFHHDPQRDDAGVDDLLARARSLAASLSPGLQVDAAAEGVVLELRSDSTHRGPGSTDRSGAATARPALADLAAAVVVVTKDAALDAVVRAAATAEGLPVRANDGAGDGGVGLVVTVVDVDDDLGDDPLHGTVLGVTRRGVPVLPSATITDWIVLPASIAHLRTKLRAAVLRRACRWLAAQVPPDEEHRLAALYELEVLDTPRDPDIDRLVDAASAAASTPIALVTLVDAQRQWFKSTLGFEATETHRDESFCAHAILSPEVLQVEDTLLDPRFADNPAVTGPARVRFYAGVPLALADGSRIGTLCVADHRPRVLDDAQLDELRSLARKVVAALQDHRGAISG